MRNKRKIKTNQQPDNVNYRMLAELLAKRFTENRKEKPNGQ